MRAISFFRLVISTTILLSQEVGFAQGRSVRTAQVIDMAASAPPRLDEFSAETPSGPGGVSGTVEPVSFRTHDLSRQWVRFQMENSFSAIDPPKASATDAYANYTGSPSAEPPRPKISIPLWMQTGAAQSAPPATFVPGCLGMPYQPTGFLEADAESRRLSHYGMMSSIACEFGIPVGLFDAVIIRESRYNAFAYSPKNAFGLTQLMPDTAAGLGVNRYSVEQNLRGGAAYLRQQLDRFGQIHLALAAYNAGPGRVRGGQVPRIAETQAYVENVLLNWRRLAGFPRAAVIQGIAAQEFAKPQNGRIATVSSF